MTEKGGSCSELDLVLSSILVTLEMTEKGGSCSELDLVLSRLCWQGHLVKVIKVGVAHGPLCRDSLRWVIHQPLVQQVQSRRLQLLHRCLQVHGRPVGEGGLEIREL